MITKDITREQFIALADYFEYVPYDVTKKDLYL